MMLIMSGTDMAGGMQRSDVEQRVWEAFPTGQAVHFASIGAESDKADDGASWGQHRQVRAEVIAELLCGAVSVEPGQVGVVNIFGARIVGKINLPSTDIKHQLKLQNCHIGDGFDLTDANIQTLSLRACYLGPTRLSRAHISGNLDLSQTHLDLRQTHLDVETDHVLDAALLTITGDLLCTDFCAEGGVHLRGARVSGRATFHGAHFKSAREDEVALNLDRLSVTGGMSCRKCCVVGGIQLRAANIEGELIFDGADLKGQKKPALNAQGLTVSGRMCLVPDVHDGKRTDFHADGQVDLTFAKITVIEDDIRCWPEYLNLDGLVYDGLYPPLNAPQRLRWLRRSGYRPQPYDQLAAFYRRQGDDEQARHVLLAKQQDRTKQRPRWLRLWGRLQDVLAGYGYRPGRAITFLVGAFIAGWVLFSIYPPAPVHAAGQPSFHAWLYTLDLIIPGAGLGQIGDWDPHGGTVFLALGLRAFGWLLAITVIAAITRALSRS